MPEVLHVDVVVKDGMGWDMKKLKELLSFPFCVAACDDGGGDDATHFGEQHIRVTMWHCAQLPAGDGRGSHHPISPVHSNAGDVYTSERVI